MATFGPESGQTNDIEDVEVEIFKKDVLVAVVTQPQIALHKTCRETLINILQAHAKVPIEMKNNPDDCDVYYCDDKVTSHIELSSKLLSYQDSLCGENSKLRVVYPRTQGQAEQPVQDLNQFSIIEK